MPNTETETQAINCPNCGKPASRRPHDSAHCPHCFLTFRPSMVCAACGHVHDHEWTLCENCGWDSAR